MKSISETASSKGHVWSVPVGLAGWVVGGWGGGRRRSSSSSTCLLSQNSQAKFIFEDACRIIYCSNCKRVIPPTWAWLGVTCCQEAAAASSGGVFSSFLFFPPSTVLETGAWCLLCCHYFFFPSLLIKASHSFSWLFSSCPILCCELWLDVINKV